MPGLTSRSGCRAWIEGSVAGLALPRRRRSSQALFHDNAGLGGGTGVIPFLVGLAWLEDGALVVEQRLLEKLDEEAALSAGP
ncbi:MAG: hypothetical protein AAFU79_25695 [Myxococcota bacterium]